MATAKVFWSGNRQAIRLPRAFRFKGAKVEIFRRGDEIVLCEIDGRGLARAFELIASSPAEIDDSPPQRFNSP
jgi:antitoxin VapB